MIGLEFNKNAQIYNVSMHSGFLSGRRGGCEGRGQSVEREVERCFCTWRDAEIENMTSLQQFILGRSGGMSTPQPSLQEFC